MGKKVKLIRITTVAISLKVLLHNQLKFMSSYFDVLAVASPDDLLKKVAEDEGVRITPIEMARTIAPLKDLKALWRLYFLFKKEKPFIVHTHTPKAGLLGMVAAKLADVPMRMHTVAGLPLMETRGIKRKLLELTERITYACAINVYPNSTILSNYIIQKKYCKTNKIKVLGNGSSNGIDTNFFKENESIVSYANTLKKNLNIKENEFVFLFIGRLVKDKGIEELIEAFTRLKKSHRNVKLLLVGYYEAELDPLSASILNLIKTDEDIIEAGFQRDVRPYLTIANVLTFPSYREGFPNVPMQAGCFNLPCIVTDINGCNEIIETGKNGLVIPVKNSDALEKAMRTLLTDAVLYQRLKSNARKMIVDRYDQKQLWNLLLNEYTDKLTRNELVPQLS